MKKRKAPPSAILEEPVALPADEDAPFLRSILESSTMYSIIAEDLLGNVVAWNEGARRLYGYATGEIIGHSAQGLYTLADVASGKVQAIRAAALATGTWSGEITRRRKDGTEFDARVTITTRHDAARTVVGFTIMSCNLAESQRRTAALQLAHDRLDESERRYRTLFETVNLVALSLDADARVDYVNPYFLRIAGYRLDEVVGRSWCDFLPAEQRPLLRKRFAELLHQDLHLHNENAIVTRAGEHRTIAWHNTVLRGPTQERIGILSIGEDITELRDAERLLAQVQKMEAVGQLAGGIAHDFNNLLAAITIFTELAQGGMQPDDPARDDLDQVHAAAKRAVTLTRQLLAFSRQQVLQPRVLDPNAVITEVQTMLERLIGEHIELATTLAPRAGFVCADAGQIEQVLLNLAVNARDAMPSGGRLTMSTEATAFSEQQRRDTGLPHAGRYVVITVTDTGTGMTADTMARAFEPFFTTKGRKGTGLGLATVYGIVHQSGGHVTVDSAPGKGSTFRVYLPAVDETPEIAAAGAQEPVGGTETLLITEDDPAVRSALKAVLVKLGYTVLVAANGGEAIDQARTHAGPVHLLITDIVMPGIDGRELAAQLRVSRPELKSLLLSGYAGDVLSSHGGLKPGTPFLEKPFSTVSLAHKIREVLGASPARKLRKPPAT